MNLDLLIKNGGLLTQGCHWYLSTWKANGIKPRGTFLSQKKSIVLNRDSAPAIVFLFLVGGRGNQISEGDIAL